MTSQTTMTMTLPDGTSTGPFTLADLKAATHKITRLPLRETEPDRAVRDNAYRVTADELRSFIERFEQVEIEKRDLAEQQKEIMAEAKGRGYDTKILRIIVALRKRNPVDVAEECAVLDLYKTALGMQ